MDFVGIQGIQPCLLQSLLGVWLAQSGSKHTKALFIRGTQLLAVFFLLGQDGLHVVAAVLVGLLHLFGVGRPVLLDDLDLLGGIPRTLLQRACHGVCRRHRDSLSVKSDSRGGDRLAHGGIVFCYGELLLL